MESSSIGKLVISVSPSAPNYLNFFFFFLEIGDIAGVADVTIRQSYKLMYPRAAELFPEDFKFFTPIENLPQL